MPWTNKTLGYAGEDIAASYLLRHGFTICNKNWTIPGGELDLVVEKWDQTIFVEVKFRTNTKLGHSRETLSPLKRKHLRRSGFLYALKHGLSEASIRFDFIAIQKISTGYHIEHFSNIEV